MLKHQTKPKIRQLIPTVVFPALLLILLSPFTLLALIPALAWAVTCLLYGAVIAAKEHKRYLFMMGPAAMIMHSAWSLGFWQAVIKHKLK